MSAKIDPNVLIAPTAYGRDGAPHETWTLLRREDPVHWCEPDGFEPFWSIVRHADIMEISGQPELFSNLDGPMILSAEQKRAQEERGETSFGGMRTIIEMDPPEHRDFRKVASGFFTPRSIDRLDEIVDESARELVDTLGDEGEGDLVELLAQRHPLRVLSTILGIDRDDEEKVLELTQQLFGAEDPDLQRQGEDRDAAVRELGLEFFQLFNRIVQDRRAHPRDDLASLLANAKMRDGEPMGDIETFGYYLIVFTAGHDTTRNAISGGLAALIEHPEELAKLHRDPGLTRRAVEEIVRWTSPVNYMKRRVLRDTEFRGRELREGQHLGLFYCSANRDDDVFDEPFAFRIDRQPNRHLGFGTGEHFCLGAHVARASSRALFRELAARLESIEYAGEPEQIQSSFVVGLKHLPARYKLRARAD